jgi:hypothetical protein
LYSPLDSAYSVRGVSFSPALKWFIILLLPLTLGWKLAARQGVAQEPTQGQQLRVAEFLVRQHFTVAIPNQGEARPTVRATAGPCQMVVTRSDPIGWQTDEIHRSASKADRVFFVFGGRIYPQQPTWLTVSDLLWSRFRRELGFNVQATPVLAIIATTNCDAERLPWSQLR